MTRPPLFAGLALLVLFTHARPTLALWGRYPNDKPVVAENWPQEIVKAINSQRRTYGAGSWDNGWSFYFIGNTDDLNSFLEQVAADKVSRLNIELSEESGVAQVQSEPLGKDLRIEYSWSLYLYPYRDGLRPIELDPLPGETPEKLAARTEAARAKLPEYGATITVHCVGAVSKETLRLPLSMPVSLGGRLATLVQFHNERRASLQSGADAARASPTTLREAEGKGRGLFGNDANPATQPAD